MTDKKILAEWNGYDVEIKGLPSISGYVNVTAIRSKPFIEEGTYKKNGSVSIESLNDIRIFYEESLDFFVDRDGNTIDEQDPFKFGLILPQWNLLEMYRQMRRGE